MGALLHRRFMQSLFSERAGPLIQGCGTPEAPAGRAFTWRLAVTMRIAVAA
jgi:hypothetical protein